MTFPVTSLLEAFDSWVLADPVYWLFRLRLADNQERELAWMKGMKGMKIKPSFLASSVFIPFIQAGKTFCRGGAGIYGIGKKREWEPFGI